MPNMIHVLLLCGPTCVSASCLHCLLLSCNGYFMLGCFSKSFCLLIINNKQTLWSIIKVSHNQGYTSRAVSMTLFYTIPKCQSSLPFMLFIMLYKHQTLGMRLFFCFFLFCFVFWYLTHQNNKKFMMQQTMLLKKYY